MKNFLIIFTILFAATSLEAQTITLGPITTLGYCVGDSITVPYQTNVTFAADNYFFVELSDANGSFSSFTSIGKNPSTNGSISFQLGSTGSNFHVKVASSDPYDTSNNNTSDIQVGAFPNPDPWAGQNGVLPNPTDQSQGIFTGGLVNSAINFLDRTSEGSGCTYFWQFNQDASPSTSSEITPAVTYTLPGLKTGNVTVTSPFGCSSSRGMQLLILDCNPVIPSDVHIVTTKESGDYASVWIKPRGNFSPSGDGQLVFVEAGASVTIPQMDESQNIYYIKPGASITIPDPVLAATALVLNTGTTISFDPLQGLLDTFYCDNLQFDYSQVQAGVADNPPPSNITILQSGDHLFANDDGLSIEIRISNILGAEVLSQRGSGALDVDLSLLPSGIYFAVIEAGNDRAVKRIAVVH